MEDTSIDTITKSIRDFRNRNAALPEVKQEAQKELYMTIAANSPKIISTLFKSLESDNEMVKLSAAKTLLSKILPDLKATEHKIDVQQQLQGLIVLADAETVEKQARADKETDVGFVVEEAAIEAEPELRDAGKKLDPPHPKKKKCTPTPHKKKKDVSKKNTKNKKWQKR